jgi:DNA (cytosine-5)-methyltransferase 1
MNELALFAGAGGGILGGHLLGWRTVCAVEWEAYPASVLCARQNDGLLPPFPIWDDVQTFDGKPWREIVDVVFGGFPCTDISAAGKGAGIDGQASGMWREMARIIYEVRPKFVFVENSPMLTSRGLGRVLGDLAKMGFDAKWGVLGAADVGANHQRDRIWIVAKNTNANREWRRGQEKLFGQSHDFEWLCKTASESNNSTNKRNSINVANTDSMRELQPQGLEKNKRRRTSNGSSEMANTYSAQRQRNQFTERSITKRTNIGLSSWWETEPDVGRVADGLAARVDRLKAIGNGQVPLCAATAWRILNESFTN